MGRRPVPESSGLSAADAVAPEEALAELFDGLDAHDGQQDWLDAQNGQQGDARRARWGARTRGGVPLGPRTLLRLSCESALTRLLVDARGLPLASSPTARQLNSTRLLMVVGPPSSDAPSTRSRGSATGCPPSRPC